MNIDQWSFLFQAVVYGLCISLYLGLITYILEKLLDVPKGFTRLHFYFFCSQLLMGYALWIGISLGPHPYYLDMILRTNLIFVGIALIAFIIIVILIVLKISPLIIKRKSVVRPTTPTSPKTEFYIILFICLIQLWFCYGTGILSFSKFQDIYILRQSAEPYPAQLINKRIKQIPRASPTYLLIIEYSLPNAATPQIVELPVLKKIYVQMKPVQKIELMVSNSNPPRFLLSKEYPPSYITIETVSNIGMFLFFLTSFIIMIPAIRDNIKNNQLKFFQFMKRDRNSAKKR